MCKCEGQTLCLVCWLWRRIVEVGCVGGGKLFVPVFARNMDRGAYLCFLCVPKDLLELGRRLR